MNYTKPSKYPRFAQKDDGDIADIDEPAETKKDTGWTDAEEPPHETFNWIHNLVSRWVKWLDQLTASNAEGVAENAEGVAENAVKIDGKADTIHQHVYSDITDLVDDSGPLVFEVALADSDGVNSNVSTVDVRYKRVAGDFIKITIEPRGYGDRLDWDISKPVATDTVYVIFTLVSGTIPEWATKPWLTHVPCALSFQSSQVDNRAYNTVLLIQENGVPAIALEEYNPEHPILFLLYPTSTMY